MQAPPAVRLLHNVVSLGRESLALLRATSRHTLSPLVVAWLFTMTLVPSQVKVPSPSVLHGPPPAPAPWIPNGLTLASPIA